MSVKKLMFSLRWKAFLATSKDNSSKAAVPSLSQSKAVTPRQATAYASLLIKIMY